MSKKPKIICISGKARSGKDYTANHMKRMITNITQRNKGCPAQVLIYHQADLLKYLCRNLFGWNGVKDENGRRLLQYVGTDIVRKKNENYWVDFTISILELFDNMWDYVIIPDTRFPNEITRFSERGYNVIHIRIERDNYDNGLSITSKEHSSEHSLDNFTPDILLKNTGDEKYIDIVQQAVGEVLE